MCYVRLSQHIESLLWMTFMAARVPATGARLLFGTLRPTCLPTSSFGSIASQHSAFHTPRPYSQRSLLPTALDVRNGVFPSPLRLGRLHYLPLAAARSISFTSNRPTSATGIAKLLPASLQAESGNQSANLGQLFSLVRPEKKTLLVAFGLVS